MVLENNSRADYSLQVSNIENVSGEYENLEAPFLVKVKSDDNTSGYIDLEVIPWSQSTPIVTRFYEGWNPELLSKITVPDTAGFYVQIGY